MVGAAATSKPLICAHAVGVLAAGLGGCAAPAWPVAITMEPLRPVAERNGVGAGVGETYHAFLLARSLVARRLWVAGEWLEAGGAHRWLASCEAPPHEFAVPIEVDGVVRTLRVPFTPGTEDHAGAPELSSPLRDASTVSASFHARNHARSGRRHAVDLVPDGPDHTVVAPCPGSVVACSRHHPEGAPTANEIHLQRDDGFTVVLSHLRGASVRVQVGEWVDSGDELAQLGNTGHSTGLHVHLELRGRDGRTVPFALAGDVPSRGDVIQPPSGLTREPAQDQGRL